MIRRLLCWLGFHKYDRLYCTKENSDDRYFVLQICQHYRDCLKCKYHFYKCNRCGKVKR